MVVDTAPLEGSRSAPATPPAAPEDLGNDIDSLLEAGLGFRKAVPPKGAEAPADDLEDDDADDQLDLEDDDEDLEPEGEDSSAESQPPARQPAPGEGVQPEQLDTWAEAVRTNARRISQIPTPHRAEAITRALEMERTNAIEERNQVAYAAIRQADEIAYQRGLAHGATVGQLESQFAELDDFSDEEYGAWARKPENRTLARQYQQWTEADRPALQPPAQQAPTVTDAIPLIAPLLINELKAVPGVFEQLEARNSDGRYNAATPQAFAQLIRDAVEVLAGLAAKSPAEDPQTRLAAQRRREGAATRRKLPKPDVAEGQRAKNGLSNDINELIRQGLGFSS